jgi:hypothetical protein
MKFAAHAFIFVFEQRQKDSYLQDYDGFCNSAGIAQGNTAPITLFKQLT